MRYFDGDRFEIVVEHVGLRRDDDFERAGLAQKIRRQHLDGRRRADAPDRFDHLREMARAAVGKIVAIDRGDDDMREAELGDGVGDARGLVRIERARASRS